MTTIHQSTHYLEQLSQCFAGTWGQTVIIVKIFYDSDIKHYNIMICLWTKLALFDERNQGDQAKKQLFEVKKRISSKMDQRSPLSPHNGWLPRPLKHAGRRAGRVSLDGLDGALVLTPCTLNKPLGVQAKCSLSDVARPRIGSRVLCCLQVQVVEGSRGTGCNPQFQQVVLQPWLRPQPLLLSVHSSHNGWRLPLWFSEVHS